MSSWLVVAGTEDGTHLLFKFFTIVLSLSLLTVLLVLDVANPGACGLAILGASCCLTLFAATTARGNAARRFFSFKCGTAALISISDAMLSTSLLMFDEELDILSTLVDFFI